MKKVFLFLFGILAFTMVNAQSLNGTWKYSMEEPPYGYDYYSEGKVVFKTVDKKQVAVIMFEYEKKTIELKKVKNTYQGNLFVEGSNVSLVFSLNKQGQLKADMTLDGIFYDINLEKVKK